MMATLLPPNATPLERALEADGAQLGDIPVPIDTLWIPETCPAALLPWLAYSVSVDLWNPDWPESVKRQVIAAAFDVHRIKGTLGAVRTRARGARPGRRRDYRMVRLRG